METNALQSTPALPYSEYVTPARYRDLRPRGFKWVKAASQLASGSTVKDVAASLEVSAGAVHRWKRDKRFIALLARYEARITEESIHTGVANQNARLRKQDKRWKQLHEDAEPITDVAAKLPVYKEIRELERLVAQDTGGMFSPQAAVQVNVSQFVVVPTAPGEQVERKVIDLSKR